MLADFARPRGSVETAIDRGLVFGWRLLGANNREIARGIEQYLSVEECEQVVDRPEGASTRTRSIPRISFDAQSHGWSWVLRSELGEVAKSRAVVPPAARMPGSVAQFKEKFSDAVVLLPKLPRGVGAFSRSD